MSMKNKTVMALAALALGGAATAAIAAGASVKVEATPTAAETAALRHALGKDYAEMAPFTVGHADLNGDHKPDLVFRTGNSDYCGSGGCATSALLATASVFLSGGYFLLTVAMRGGEMSLIAPFRYTGLLFAIVIGYLVWGDVPNAVAWAGIALLVMAGLYILQAGRLPRRLAVRNEPQRSA